MIGLKPWLEQLDQASPGELAKVLVDAGRLTLPLLNALLAEPTKYWPTGGQALLHGNTAGRIKLAAGGWRSGKSRYTAREITFPLVVRDKPKAWVIGADYELAREEFQYTLLDIKALGYPVITDLSMPQQGRWRMALSNGGVLETQTAEDLRKIEAANLDAAALVEAGSLNESLLTATEGRLTEKRGIAILSGRFRGTFNWYADLFRLGQASNDRRVVSASLKTWDNRYFYPPCDPATCIRTESWKGESHGGFHNEEILYHYKNRSEDEFGEMFAAEPRPDRDLVYADYWDRGTHMIEMEFEEKLTGPIKVVDGGGKIIGFRLPKTSPVEVWVDPGYRGAYAVLARQKHGGEIFVIDEMYERGKTASEIVQLLKLKWYWPYVTGGAIDVAGTQHHGVPSNTEIWLKDARIYLHSERILVPDGIERVRTFLRNPMTKRPAIWFSPKCVMLAWEMEAGFRYIKSRGSADVRGEKEEPIDTDNHSCSALAYGLIKDFGRSGSDMMSEPRTIAY